MRHLLPSFDSFVYQAEELRPCTSNVEERQGKKREKQFASQLSCFEVDYLFLGPLSCVYNLHSY